MWGVGSVWRANGRRGWGLAHLDPIVNQELISHSRLKERPKINNKYSVIKAPEFLGHFFQKRELVNCLLNFSLFLYSLSSEGY